MGSSLSETIQGDDQNNRIEGRNGADTLYGLDGDDTLLDGIDKDRLYGGAGSDLYVMTLDRHTDAIFDFELGQDRIDISDWGVSDIDQLDLRLHRGRFIIQFDKEVLSVRGTTQFTEADFTADLFVFADAAEGPLTITGTAGRDRLIGTELDEIIEDGAGKDNMFGRAGADTFVLALDGDADNIKDFESGIDKIDLSAWSVTFDDLAITQQREGKVLVSFGDERLSVADAARTLLVADLDADQFLF